MRMDRKSTIVSAVMLLAGVAAGWIAADIATPDIELPKAVVSRAAAQGADDGDGDIATQLRGRVSELEELTAQLKGRISELEEQNANLERTAGPEERVGGERNRGGMRFGPPTEEDLEKLKAENPEEYTRTTNRIARMERHFKNMMRREAERRDIIASIDESFLTAEQKAVHQRFQELQDAVDEMRMSFRPDDESMTDEDRRSHFESMRELERALSEAAESERDVLLSAAVGTVGLEGDDATDFVDTIKAVYEATQTGRGPGGPGGPPPPGFGRRR